MRELSRAGSLRTLEGRRPGQERCPSHHAGLVRGADDDRAKGRAAQDLGRQLDLKRKAIEQAG